MEDMPQPQITQSQLNHGPQNTGTRIKKTSSLATVTQGASLLKPRVKSNKIALLAIFFIAVISCAISGIIHFLSVNNRNEYTIAENILQESDMDGTIENDQKNENEVLILSLNDPLVQELYEHFNHHIGVLSAAFYSENGGLSGNIDEKLMTGLALEHVIRDKTNLFYRFEQDLGCYKAEPVRDKIYKIFGENVEFFEGMGLPSDKEALHTYYKDIDAFCLIGGFDSMANIHHNLYKAEKSGNNINLYVVAGVVDTRGANSEDGYWGMVQPIFSGGNGYKYEKYPYHPTGDDNTDIMEYANQLGRFKWTFTESADGNYVLVSLKKV